jgi:serine/threonine-protein kinase
VSADELSEGQILADKYRVERVLGSGGMGVVLAATHVQLEQRVAIKVLKRDFAESEAIAERFRREARAACKIRSPHGARVLDVGTTDDGLPYMVMEFLHGHDLSAELEHKGQLSISEAASYVLQAGDAICDAHDESIIHRDIKPANLFLTERGGFRNVKVLDFGISKSLHESAPGVAALTHTQALVGSPMYMSPEQLDSPRTVDARTDIWSLGVVLYELVTGSPPFLADGIAGLIKRIVADAPPPLSDFGVDAPPEFEEIILRCLAKDREDRYATVRELMAALAPFAPDSPLSRQYFSGSPHSPSETTQKLHRTRVSGKDATGAGDAASGGATTQMAVPQTTQTQFNQSNTKDPGPSGKRGAVVTISAVALLCAVLGGVFLLRGGATTEPDVPLGAPPPVVDIDEGRAIEPTPTIPSAVEPAVASSEPAPVVLQAPAPSASSETTPVTAPTVGRPRARPRKKVENPASAGEPEAKPPSGISDFGGRH